MRLANLAMNPPLHPSQEGNLQPVLQTKLPSSEGPGVGSWAVRNSLGNRVLFMNLQVGLRRRQLALRKHGGAAAPPYQERVHGPCARSGNRGSFPYVCCG
jgi:hypothetical protein